MRTDRIVCEQPDARLRQFRYDESSIRRMLTDQHPPIPPAGKRDATEARYVMLHSISACRLNVLIAAVLVMATLLSAMCGCSLHTTTSSSSAPHVRQSKSTTAPPTVYARAAPPSRSAPSNSLARATSHDELQELLDASKTPATDVVWCAVASGPEGKDIIWIQVPR
jgi:hypothetical protein